MKFLIQKNKTTKKLHDFSQTLIDSCDFLNWKVNKKCFTYQFSDKPNVLNKKIVPIGDINFVLDHIKLNHNLLGLKPKNIPIQLNNYDFLDRNVQYMTGNIYVENKSFVKQNDVFKGITGIYENTEFKGDFIISDIIPNILSEYRCFVFENKLVGIKHYAGDFTLFPNVNKIKHMISTYKSDVSAYTLDVAIINNNNQNTVLIEVHDFFSCGLYGFDNYDVIPFMFYRTYQDILRNLRNKSS